MQIADLKHSLKEADLNVQEVQLSLKTAQEASQQEIQELKQ